MVMAQLDQKYFFVVVEGEGSQPMRDSRRAEKVSAIVRRGIFGCQVLHLSEVVRVELEVTMVSRKFDSLCIWNWNKNIVIHMQHLQLSLCFFFLLVWLNVFRYNLMVKKLMCNFFFSFFLFLIPYVFLVWIVGLT